MKIRILSWFKFQGIWEWQPQQGEWLWVWKVASGGEEVHCQWGQGEHGPGKNCKNFIIKFFEYCNDAELFFKQFIFSILI